MESNTESIDKSLLDTYRFKEPTAAEATMSYEFKGLAFNLPHSEYSVTESGNVIIEADLGLFGVDRESVRTYLREYAESCMSHEEAAERIRRDLKAVLQVGDVFVEIEVGDHWNNKGVKRIRVGKPQAISVVQDRVAIDFDIDVSEGSGD